MMTLRKAHERGHANFGWLDSFHTFSFGNYYDPKQMGFKTLRVINEDKVRGGEGFPTHPHKDMEIISYVVSGALEHRDSTGGGGVIRPGDVQLMSAGAGVTHSEYNHSEGETVHFLQIWIMPNAKGVQPGYQQQHFPMEQRRGRLRLLVSQDGREGSLRAHTDALLWGSVLGADEQVSYPLAKGRSAWVQVVKGAVSVNGTRLDTSDGAAIQDETALVIEATGDAEFLLFDLA
jgi:redox-sensitive bicupin YhaK (pirin superfamily)